MAALALAALTMGSAPLAAGTTGRVQMDGDKNFDCDSIASSSRFERRWLSFPGGRLCANPAVNGMMVKETPEDLSLEVGGYVGTAVVRMPKVVRVGMVPASDPGSPAGWSTTRRSIWYPYQLDLKARFATGARVTVEDVFIGEGSTLIRSLDVSDGKEQLLCLSGTKEASATISWDDAGQALVVDGTNYFYALRFARLEGKERAMKPLTEKPVVNDGEWRLLLPLESGAASYGVAFGFATPKEGRKLAIARAKRAFEQPVAVSTAAVKTKMEEFLRQVPAPQDWGFGSVKDFGVTPEEHRKTYYMAWAFLYQSLIGVLPENPEFPYPQMSLGKGALWDGGERSSPATCGWESFLGIQWLAFIDPETAWQAFVGIMSRVDEQGRLGGESLPSRKAQTAWILFQQKKDAKRLAAVYPAIKRYLLWREANPRWIWAEDKHNVPDEKDLEFVASWLFDIEYAARIAETLDQPDEAAFWRGKAQPMIAEMDQWFFSDPRELHQYYFTERDVHSLTERNEVRPVMILSAMGLPELPPEMLPRLNGLFDSVFKPDADNAGFNYLKYPDNNFLAYGLIEREMPAARPFLEAVARDCIRGGEFAETLELDGDGKLMAGGVMPSLFNPLNLIEFTWLLNGVRYDSGLPVECSLPATAH